MRTLFFENYEDLVIELCKEHFKKENNEIAVVTHSYEEAKELLSSLTFNGLDLYNLEIEDEYDGEYLLLIDEDGVSCSKAFGNGDYKNVNVETLYISDDANSRILSFIDANEVFAYEISEDDEVQLRHNRYVSKLDNNTGSYLVNGKKYTEKETFEFLYSALRDFESAMNTFERIDEMNSLIFEALK